MAKLRVVGLLRVSTGRQVSEGDGLGVQRAAINAWAKQQGHRLIGVLADEGISGAKDLDDRPALAESLALVRQGKANGVVAHRLDRLARDLVVQESLLAEFRRAGGRVFSASPSEAEFLVDDPQDPSRKMVRQVLGAISEYERAMIRLRLSAGRHRKSEKGGYAYGAPGLGWNAHDKALVPDEAEQATLERIKDLRSSGASLRAICATLEAEGRPTKRGKTTWHSAAVGRIVQRPLPAPRSHSRRRKTPS